MSGILSSGRNFSQKTTQSKSFGKFSSINFIPENLVFKRKRLKIMKTAKFKMIKEKEILKKISK
jgi:hypothetical protein